MLICYARVSTEDQNLDLQLDVLRAAGYRQVCTDKVGELKLVGCEENGAGIKAWRSAVALRIPSPGPTRRPAAMRRARGACSLGNAYVRHDCFVFQGTVSRWCEGAMAVLHFALASPIRYGWHPALS